MSAARSSCQANQIQFETVFIRREDGVVGGGASSADVGKEAKVERGAPAPVPAGHVPHMLAR